MLVGKVNFFDMALQKCKIQCYSCIFMQQKNAKVKHLGLAFKKICQPKLVVYFLWPQLTVHVGDKNLKYFSTPACVLAQNNWEYGNLSSHDWKGSFCVCSDKTERIRSEIRFNLTYLLLVS